LEAAQVSFSRNSYEGVGVREIATHAKVDPALVIRYFGSKEGLFRAVAERAFSVGGLLSVERASLSQHAARFLLGQMDTAAWRTGYDPLRLLLCSIGSAEAGPILGRCLQRDFAEPLARALGGRHARERAAMLCSLVVGFALMRIALSAGHERTMQPTVMKRLLQRALEQAILVE
jgi:AcrR family transcriptional regulator